MRSRNQKAAAPITNDPTAMAPAVKFSTCAKGITDSHGRSPRGPARSTVIVCVSRRPEADVHQVRDRVDRGAVDPLGGRVKQRPEEKSSS